MGLIVNVYSHGIAINDLTDQRDRDVLLQFCRPLIQYRLERSRGRMVRTAFKTYAGALRNRSEFRFHVNQLTDLLQFLENNGYKDDRYKVIKHTANLDDYPEVEHKWISPFSPRDKQPGIIEHVLSKGQSKMVTLQTGQGKAVWDETLVRTPNGWKRMRLIKIGDEVVSRDGTATKVTGVYPQGEVQLYKVTFDDGRSVEACAEHLWYCKLEDKWEVRNTSTMCDALVDNKQVSIPLYEPEETPDVVLPLDPFLYGFLLGNLRLGSKRATFSSPHLAETIKKYIPKDVKIIESGRDDGLVYIVKADPKNARNSVFDALHDEEEGIDPSPFTRQIPLIYLNASPRQRRELLKGLRFSSICKVTGKVGRIVFRPSSQQLAEDIVKLIRSLGGKSEYLIIPVINKRTKEQTYSYNEVSMEVKDLSAVSPYDESEEHVRKPIHSLYLNVKSITPSRIAPATCIAVDHPEKLFVVQDYIVTHNTFIAMWCTTQLKLRTVFIFKGGYVDRWLGDLQKTFEFDDTDELVVVRGSGGLIRLMDDALDGSIKAKVIILTGRTFYDYLKDHEATNGKSELYPIPANEFYQQMGIGFRVIDEVHQEFHFNYRQDLYAHTLKSLSLSATLTSNDRFMNKVYDIAYPVNERNDGGGYHVYISVTALMYRMTKPEIYRYKGATGGYSHNALEQSIRSKKDFYPKYLRIFEYVTKVKFFNVYEKGQKMLIFCASVDLCTAVVEYLTKAFPTLVIGRYTQEDDYATLEVNDVTVSTVLSAGTAVDIPNLRVTFMSTAIDSRQSNEQALGRTRPLKDWPKVDPEFVYLVCEDFDRQMAYHANKKDYFRNKVLNHNELLLPFSV